MTERIAGLLLGCLCLCASLGAQSISIVPKPLYLQAGSGHFELKYGSRLICPSDRADFLQAAVYWQEFMQEHLRFTLTDTASDLASTAIEFRFDASVLNPEGYHMSVSPARILIRASSGKGIFYACQTLRQLLPAQIESRGNGLNPPYAIPCCEIRDEPRFSYRGMHLDVSRHFFAPSFIKQYIDLLAMQKMNTFHWHLTDDQGWRIEIKKYPKLTQAGAFRKETLIGHYSAFPARFDGMEYGGFYYQDEIRDIIEYARKRFVTIIPEIEMPGHALAALAAYPELGCTGGPYEVAGTWGVFNEVFCPSEQTFAFLQGVLDEVAALFPGEYIHIGGDECPKDSWKKSPLAQEVMRREGLRDEHELQSYFIRRIEKYLNQKGKKIIGWDEILEGGLAPNATVMSWRGTEGGIAAARSGHNAIMTPGSHCYFDYYQSTSSNEPLAIGGYLPLEKVYSYEPVPAGLDSAEARHILGAQGNVWTEYIADKDQVLYMAYPRATALAEVVWSAREGRNFDEFSKRLAVYLQRLEANRLRFGNHIYNVRYRVETAPAGVKIHLESRDTAAEIRFTTNMDRPGPRSTLYKEPFTLLSNAVVKANTFKKGKPAGSELTLNFAMHKAAGKNVQVSEAPNPAYNLGGIAALTDGLTGSNLRYGDDQWLGWSGKTVEAVIDLGSEQPVSKFIGRFYQANNAWIYMPEMIYIYTSSDGKQYQLAAQQPVIPDTTNVIMQKVEWMETRARFVKIRVEPHGKIAADRPGAGQDAWLFIDELFLE